MADDWRDRFRGVAEAQTPYLYLLLGLAGLFFFALHLALPETVATAVQGIPISAEVVWATGPAVLGFLLAACGGTFAAMGHADRQMELGHGGFEREDVRPNALDMVAYTTDGSSAWARAVGGITYAAYLSFFFVEGVWWRLATVDDREPALHVALLIGAAMLVLGVMRTWRFVWGRVVRFWRAARKREEPLTLATAIEALTEAEAALRTSGEEVVTRHKDGLWEFLVDGKPAGVAVSLPELAAAVRRWIAER